MLDVSTVILFVTVFVLTYIYRMGRRPDNMPPGPKTWPFLGNLDIFYNSDKLHVKTAELGKKYNGMFSLQHGKHPGLIITDFSIAKEAFIDQADVFSDRVTHTDFSRSISAKKDKGLLQQSGEEYKELKRLTLQSMRDFGVGKATIEEKILTEAHEVLKEIEKQDGKPFTFELIFNKAVTNVICQVLFDKRYSYDDPEYTGVILLLNNLIRLFGFRNIFQFLPWYTFILVPIMQPQLRTALRNIGAVKQWIQKQIDEHKERFDQDNIRDFVDIYLQAQQTEHLNTYSNKQLFETIFQLFGAGSETTSTTLLWVIIFLTRYPEIQRRCRHEISQNIGDRPVSYKDRTTLPYLEATLSEIMRLSNTVPLVPVLHNTKTQTTLRGYTIPRNTLVHLNTYAIHMDHELWDEPKVFKPERFLDENGQYLKPEAFVPFSLGRRACLGESLAKMELFLFVAEMLQKFEFQAEDQSKLPTPDETTLGVTLIPGEFYVKAVKVN